MSTTGPYRIADLRRCYPHIGLPTIDYWRKRGFLAHSTERRGRLEHTVFVLPQLVHDGVIIGLSALAALQASQIEVWLDDDDTQTNGALTRPDEIIALYERLNWNVTLSLYSTVSARIHQDPRTATAELGVNVLISPPTGAESLFSAWRDRDSMFRGYMSNVAFIDVYAVLRHICRTLEIDLPDGAGQSAARVPRKQTLLITPRNEG